VNPPRGVNLEAIFERLDETAPLIDLFNVTDSALARMKCAALPFGALLKGRYGIEALVNLSCRDRNLIALQGDLLGAYLHGVRSVVALTGDAVSTGDYPEGKGVFEVNSVGLLETIKLLNNGHDIVGNSLKGLPEIVPGVVFNPNARNINAEIRKLSKKRDAGARYALSQPIFEIDRAKEVFAEASKVGVPLLLGLLPLKNVKSAKGVAKIPGIKLSPDLAKFVEREDDTFDLSEVSLSNCLELYHEVSGSVTGYHVIAGTHPKLGLRLVKELRVTFKNVLA
jgi:5,10-methylenetetrahydrofolate reductase